MPGQLWTLCICPHVNLSRVSRSTKAAAGTAPSRNTFSLKHIFRVTSFEQGTPRPPISGYVRGPSGATINLKNKTEKKTENHDTDTAYSLSRCGGSFLQTPTNTATASTAPSGPPRPEKHHRVSVSLAWVSLQILKPKLRFRSTTRLRLRRCWVDGARGYSRELQSTLRAITHVYENPSYAEGLFDLRNKALTEYQAAFM